jgi:hypothetical protein
LDVGLPVAIWWCWQAPSRNQAEKFKHLAFLAPPYEQFNSFVLPVRCDARHFILNEGVRNSALALH